MLRDVVTALIEVQLEEISARRTQRVAWRVTPAEITDDVFRHFGTIPQPIRTVLELAIDSLDANDLRNPLEWFAPRFSRRSLAGRVALLRKRKWGGLGWEALSYALTICWLVMFSHAEVREAIGSAVLPSPPDAAPDDSVIGVDVAAPLDVVYDVCVIGSGAGGSLAAFRLGAAGKSVLLADSGKWVPPQDLASRHDHALASLYKDSGVTPALPTIGAVIAGRPGGINFLQANVFGGGPYVNNAIQLPIDKRVFDSVWRARGFPIEWSQLAGAIATVARDLRFGASSLDPAAVGDPRASARPGERSNILLAAAKALWPATAANPVSLWDCVGCGQCNIGCRYNRKTGGVHGRRAAGDPKSYLMRAIEDTNGRVKLRSELQAIRFVVNAAGRVTSMTARDLTTGKLVSVNASCFVLAAGPVASSRILQDTSLQLRPAGCKIGQRIAANVTTPVSAIMSAGVAGTSPAPGTQMCFYVEPETGVLLEGWFDYPASVSAASNGLPQQVAASLADFSRLNVFGVVIPVDDLATVMPPPVEIAADLKPADFRRLVRAIAHAACALYRAGAESVMPGHRLNTNVVGPIVIDKTSALAGDVDGIAADLLRRLGGPQDLSLQTPHPQGGNAMATLAKDGVVAKSFKVFGTSNLFVADSSLFPAGCGRNPQLTTLALAHLASASVADCIDRGLLDQVEL